MPRIVPVLLLSLMWSLPTSAGVYKWKDKDGRIHYGDAPPEKSKAAEIRGRISSIKGPAVVSDLTPKSMANDATQSGRGGKVRIFTTQSCGYCKRAKAFLNARGTAYEELDVEASQAAYQEYKAMGGHGVPVILVGTQRMNGFSAQRLEEMLKGAGI